MFFLTDYFLNLQLADVLISNTQEKALKESRACNSEVVFYSFSIGLVYLGAALIVTGLLVPAIHVASQVFFVFLPKE